jgi:hypothetical protein
MVLSVRRKHGDRFERFLVKQQFFAAGTALADVDRRPNASVGQASIEDQFHITGTFELLENRFVHPAVGIDQRGSDDRQRAAFLECAGGCEQLSWEYPSP